MRRKVKTLFIILNINISRYYSIILVIKNIYFDIYFDRIVFETQKLPQVQMQIEETRATALN